MNNHHLSRFNSKWAKSSQGCWEWTARRNKCGYGIFVMGHAKAFLAHRVAYSHWKESIPDGMNVLHRCDNPACVNPDHLFIGTQADNVADMMRKKRNVSVPKFGEANPMAKLTAEKVSQIRKRYVPRKVTLKILATEYGVSEASIHNAIKGKRWSSP